MTSLVIARHFVIVLRVLRELEQTQKCEGIPVSTMYNYKMMMENVSKKHVCLKVPLKTFIHPGLN